MERWAGELGTRGTVLIGDGKDWGFLDGFGRGKFR